MRIATYNVEWFASLFDEDNQLLCDDGASGRQGVSRAAQIDALGHVFAAMDADAVMIVEAPDQGRQRDTVEALERLQRVLNCGREKQQWALRTPLSKRLRCCLIQTL